MSFSRHTLLETLLVSNGRPQRLGEHLKRLASSADALGLAPRPDLEEIAAAVARAAADLGAGKGGLRILVGAGAGAAGWSVTPRSYRYRGDERWTVAAVKDRRRPDAARVRHKTTSREPLDAARAHARTLGADDALLVRADGTLTEGPAWNVFWLEGSELLSPAVACGVLPGVTRAALLDLAPRLGWRPRVGRFPVARLRDASAVWATNALVGAARLTALDGTPLGRPGAAAIVARVGAALQSPAAV